VSDVGRLSVQSVSHALISSVWNTVRPYLSPSVLSVPPAAIGRLLVPPHPKPAIRRGLRFTPPADSAASGFPPVCFSHTNHDTILPFRDCRPPIGRFVGRPRVNSALAAAHRPLPMLHSCSFSPQLRVVHDMLNFILAPVVVHTRLFQSSYCVFLSCVFVLTAFFCRPESLFYVSHCFL
jgi:hypothetical protein